MADACIALSDPSSIAPLGATTEAEERFFKEWRKDIEHAAASAVKKFSNPIVEAEDFGQEACIRLLVALRGQGTLPESHVRTLISCGVLSARRGRLRTTYHELSIEDAPRESPEEENEEPAVERIAAPTEVDPALVIAVADWTKGLPENLRSIYEMLYQEGLAQAEAALRLGVSRQRISQLNVELLRRGREHFGCLPS